MTITWMIAAIALAAPATHETPGAGEILAAIDDVYQGRTTEGTMEMEVITPEWSRTMRLRVWSKGRDVFLIRIQAPAKDRGVSTLRDGKEIWNYLPNIDRTVKIPVAMLASPWMGSDLTNDDLVKMSRLARDYVGRVTKGADGGAAGVVEVTAVPKEGVAVVWNRVVALVRRDGLIPERVEYYGEDGALARTMRFSDVRSFGGRRVPATITVEPAHDPGHRTILRYLDLEFDRPMPEGRFTIYSLRHP